MPDVLLLVDAELDVVSVRVGAGESVAVEWAESPDWVEVRGFTQPAGVQIVASSPGVEVEIDATEGAPGGDPTENYFGNYFPGGW